jgi:flagellar M-ring protein FliF
MRLAAMAGVGVGVLAFFIYLTTRMTTPHLELLYGDLQLADANQIVKQLEAQKIPFELRRDGTEIWVPKDKKLQMRVKLAEVSMPSGGSLSPGYELFDNGDVLSQTSFMQNLKLVRAMEGELARTIRSMDRVEQARVHLVMPKREMFSRETQEPSASVIVKTKGTLQASQVQAIQNIVASAVPRLKPSRISIADEHGRLLARGFEDDQTMMSATMEERRLAEQQRLTDKIVQILGRIVGADNIKAEVTVEMDSSRIATTQEIYDPNGQVVRSTVAVNENEKSEDRETPQVSVSQNLPDAQTNQSGAKSSSSQARTQETTNYEITKKVVNQVKEFGEIKRISAAVAINGLLTKDAAGKETYQERDKKTMDALAAAVRSAVGYDQNRGDVVEVVNLRFAAVEDPFKAAEDSKIWGFEREFLEQIAQNLGLFIVAVLFLLLVLKPLITRAVESMGPGGVPDSRRLLTDQSSSAPQLTGPPGMPATVPGLALPDEAELDELIDLDKVEGRVKASSIRKIGEIVEKHPEEALSIIRNWMYQET